MRRCTREALTNLRSTRKTISPAMPSFCLLRSSLGIFTFLLCEPPKKDVDCRAKRPCGTQGRVLGPLPARDGENADATHAKQRLTQRGDVVWRQAGTHPPLLFVLLLVVLLGSPAKECRSPIPLERTQEHRQGVCHIHKAGKELASTTERQGSATQTDNDWTCCSPDLRALSVRINRGIHAAGGRHIQSKRHTKQVKTVTCVGRVDAGPMLERVWA